MGSKHCSLHPVHIMNVIYSICSFLFDKRSVQLLYTLYLYLGQVMEWTVRLRRPAGLSRAMWTLTVFCWKTDPTPACVNLAIQETGTHAQTKMTVESATPMLSALRVLKACSTVCVTRDSLAMAWDALQTTLVLIIHVIQTRIVYWIVMPSRTPVHVGLGSKAPDKCA